MSSRYQFVKTGDSAILILYVRDIIQSVSVENSIYSGVSLCWNSYVQYKSIQYTVLDAFALLSLGFDLAVSVVCQHRVVVLVGAAILAILTSRIDRWRSFHVKLSTPDSERELA